jgi:hypothetical protein
MSLSTASSAGLTSLSGILVGSGSASAPPASAVSLAGFDAVVQMSRKLLQSQVEQSLATANLAAPSAYVPWGSIPLQENFKDLLVQLLVIMAFPILNPFQVDSTSISGFASSAMQTFLVRWALPPAIQVVNPGGGGLLV